MWAHSSGRRTEDACSRVATFGRSEVLIAGAEVEALGDHLVQVEPLFAVLSRRIPTADNNSAERRSLHVLARCN